jgi:anti-sigma-K factor RskA
VSSGTDPYAHLDAAYILGALDPAERVEFEAHLRTCADCRARVEEVRSVPALLAGLDESAFLDDAEPIIGSPEAPPETLLPGLLRAARRERQRRRILTGGLGLVAAAGIAALILVALPSSATHPKQQRLTALVASPVSASVSLEAKKWGTELDLTCWYNNGADVPTGYKYGLTVVGADGKPDNLGTWELEPGSKITFPAGTALAPDQIKSVRITKPDGTAILQLNT